jgi:hypothetical protein
MIILLGYKTQSRRESPTVVYCGLDGEEAQKALDASLFPRVEKLHHAPTMPVRRWDEARAKALEAAEAPSPAAPVIPPPSALPAEPPTPLVQAQEPTPEPTQPEPPVEPPALEATEDDDGPQLTLDPQPEARASNKKAK